VQYYVPKFKIDTEFFRSRPRYAGALGPRIVRPGLSVSLVTRCMNRLHDLKVTLPRNLRDNADYPWVEHVLVDYNSTDGLGDWVRAEMMPHVEAGRLAYYRTDEPQFFRPNHSQNVTFRAAAGELVGNVDADNFTHAGYARRLAECASAAARVLVVPENFLLPGTKRLFLKGRFAAYRADIDALGGFDEELDEGFGNDDVSFALRAMLAGLRVVRYESRYADDRLPTTDAERVALVENKDYRAMRDRNGEVTWAKLAKGVTEVNRGSHWGRATLVKNFKDVVTV
jgi:hypothetical protein